MGFLFFKTGKEIEGSKEALKDHILLEVAGMITGAVDPAALEKEL